MKEIISTDDAPKAIGLVSNSPHSVMLNAALPREAKQCEVEASL